MHNGQKNDYDDMRGEIFRLRKALSVEQQKRKKRRVANVALVFIAITIIVFIISMIWLYYEKDGVPDTLIVSVFTLVSAEVGILGWIRTAKEKSKDGNVKGGDEND